MPVTLEDQVEAARQMVQEAVQHIPTTCGVRLLAILIGRLFIGKTPAERVYLSGQIAEFIEHGRNNK